MNWKKILQILRYLPYSVYYNFKYLPFKQALKLPILLYKPKLLKNLGHVTIKSKKIKTGMIKLGFPNVSIYPNNGITIENNGGSIRFKGSCVIGNNSFISIGEKGCIAFGDDFMSTASLKIVSYRKIEFGVSALIGWDSLIMDTNFHPLYDMDKKAFKRASGAIKIGDYNWMGTGCKVMHSVQTPERCIFGLNSVITRGATFKAFCVHGGSPLKVLAENVMLDYDNDIEIIN